MVYSLSNNTSFVVQNEAPAIRREYSVILSESSVILSATPVILSEAKDLILMTQKDEFNNITN